MKKSKLSLKQVLMTHLSLTIRKMYIGLLRKRRRKAVVFRQTRKRLQLRELGAGFVTAFLQGRT